MDSILAALANLKQRAENVLLGSNLKRWTGYVTKIVGLMIESRIPGCAIGELCEIVTDSGEKRMAEVVGFKDEKSILLLLGAGGGLHQGAKVYPTGKTLQAPVGQGLLGRIIDALGRPLDGKPLTNIESWSGIDNDPPEAYGRPRITEVFATGVRAIDGLLTMGEGQRIGLFAGSGVGKSTMLGMIARSSDAEINVIALIGERGREVQDFIEQSLGEEGLKRSVVIIATSDQPAMFRLKCLFTATTIAEYFRDKGRKVLLMVDSVTRMAMAGREVGLSVGEPPTMKGYTPSVFAMLPRILERAGRSKLGSITGIYSVLVDGDDFNEPIADTTRGVLDGHIVLSRAIGAKNHFPAIDILASVSRLFPELTTKEHQAAAGDLRNVLATYQKSEDLITIGAYQRGNDKRIDRAIDLIEPINSFLKQGMHDPVGFDLCIRSLSELMRSR